MPGRRVDFVGVDVCEGLVDGLVEAALGQAFAQVIKFVGWPRRRSQLDRARRR